jgi:thiol-disulfide isomerase/thioredoxin
MSWLRSLARFVRTGAIAALAGLACVRAEVKVDDTFPALGSAKLEPLAKGALPVTTDRVVLVDFWASWCAPCKASFPMMARLHRDFAERGLTIVAVSVDEKAAAAEAFARRLSPPFFTAHDRAQSLVKQVVVPTMPTSYLVGRDGRVRFIHVGFHGDATERELRQQLEQLLAEKPTS